jgi:hypothetical protein
LIVAALAVVPALVVRGHLDRLDAARRSWDETRPVLVAATALGPGDEILARAVEVPVALLPAGALGQLPEGARLRQRVADGEVLTELDIADRRGPAALADEGTVVVALSDPSSRDVAIGLDVQIAADGIVLAGPATIVDVVDDVVFVAVDAVDGAVVAAAAHQGIASLLYLP